MSNSIHALIPKIMSEVGAISKNKQAQSYKFRGIDDVYLALQKPLYTHGVYFVPEVLENVREEKQSKSGGLLTTAILKVRYTFFAPDGSFVQAVTIGEAMDTSDKATNKAMSAALKYALFQVFCIPTEELKDSEEDNHEPAAPQSRPPTTKELRTNGPREGTNATGGVLSEAQLKRLYAISKKCNWSKEQVVEYLAKLGLKRADEMNRSQYDHLVDLMEKYPNEEQHAV